MHSTTTLPKIVLFLGAGASSVAGYHTFAGFPDLIFSDEIRNQERLGQLHSTTQTLLKDIEQSLHIVNKATTHDNFLWALNDYTRLWHVLRVDDVLRSRFLRSTIQWSEFAYFAQTVEDAIHDLTVTTVRHYSANKVKASRQPIDPNYDPMCELFEFYRLLAVRNNSQAPYLPVFTTNYDLLLEDLTAEFGHRSKPALKLVNGFAGCTQDEAIWNEQQYEAQPEGIHLYRLHGCVSWYWDSSEQTMLQYCRNEIPEHPLANLCAIYPGCDGSLGSNPHAYGFRKLNEMLLNCTVALFIGFSFRDNDVMHILLSANAQRKQPLQLIVVDPALTNKTVIERLHSSGLKTQHPVRRPEARNIHCINIQYGIDNFSEVISNVIDQTLKG
ncbi:MAG: hypothetical protein EHM40_20705 [Chloroflexi bacterium]|nr:MAG: hypothetical protein EHM40_20705 [Chloroflexota bacterium]